MHIRILGSRGWCLPWSRISPSVSLDACTYFNLLFAAAAALSFAMANGPPPLPLLPMHSLARCPMPPLPNLTYIPPSLERDSVAPLAAKRRPHPTDPLLFLRECPCVRTCSSVCPVRPPVSWAGERDDVVVTALFSSAARFRRLPLLPFKSNRRSDRGKWIILGLKITQMMPIMENYV